MADEKAKFLNGYGLATLWSKIKAYAVDKNSTSIIIGNSSAVLTDTSNAIVIGYNSVTNSKANNSIAIGSNVSIGTSDEASIAIGKNAAVTGTGDSIAIGEATSAWFAAIAIGGSAKANASRAIAIGLQSNASDNSISIGLYANTVGSEGISIGHNAASRNTYSICIGLNTYTNANSSVIIGRSVYVSDNSGCGVAIGCFAAIANNAPFSIAIGNRAKVDIGTVKVASTQTYQVYYSSIAIGDNAHVKTNAYSSIAVGRYATIEDNCFNSIAIGENAIASYNNAIRLGNDNISRFNVKVGVSTTSDERDKTDIQNIGYGATNFLKKIRAIRYVFNSRTLYLPDEEHRTEEDKENFSKYGICEYDREAHKAGTKKGERIRVGVLAQEVLQALKDVYDDESYGNIVDDNFHDMDKSKIPDNIENQYTITYANFVPFLIKAIQEIDERLTSLERM